VGSYYTELRSYREDPLDEIYDWPEIGIPAHEFFEDDSAAVLIDTVDVERWKETELPDIWVSTYGRFYNVRTKHFIKPTHGDRQGHLAIKVRIDGKAYQQYAHRLIAKAFIPNKYDDPYVRHLDDDKSNNYPENLAWGTQLENHQDAVENGTSYEITDEDRQKSYEMSSQPVKAINKETGEILYFRSQCEASRSLGIPQANVWKVIKGERHTAGGFTFVGISKEEYGNKVY
jgi:hypothetical protein